MVERGLENCFSTAIRLWSHGEICTIEDRLAMGEKKKRATDKKKTREK